MGKQPKKPGFIKQGLMVLRYPDASLAVKAMLVGLVLYVLAPLDLMPEALFGPFGLADDAGAIGAFAWLAKTAFAYYAAREQDAQGR